MAKQLLVIGNGFDRWCRLESSFSQFMDDRVSKSPRIYTDIKRYMNGETISPIGIDQVLRENIDKIDKDFLIWDLVFLLNSTIGNDAIMWCDIEQIINKYLTASYSKIDGKLVNYWSFFEHQMIINDRPIIPTNMIQLTDYENITPYIYMYMKKKEIKRIDKNNPFIYKLISDHLRKFEEDFCRYLNNKLRLNQSYIDNKMALLNKLTVSKINLEETQILSFNYTYIKVLNQITKVENVHGTLSNNNCIIGIDNSKIDYDNPVYRFTKTYRKVDYYSKNNTKVVVDVLSDDFTHITFFGHSLNEQDYAYFQSIFDTLDIYNSHVKLLFLFSVYDETKRDLIQTEITSKVVRLLEDYGRTFISSPAKGKNLLHKLLISSRLKIKEIPQIPSEIDYADDLFVY